MSRMKTFLIYLLLIVGFYIFSDFASFAYIKTTYQDLNRFTIEAPNPKVKIYESKATYINGYIKGTLLNNEEQMIENKYVKFEFFSERDIYLGKKYVKIDKLAPNEETSFEVKFNIENVDHYKITLTDESENVSEADLQLDQETKGILLITTLVFLYF